MPTLAVLAGALIAALPIGTPAGARAIRGKPATIVVADAFEATVIGQQFMRPLVLVKRKACAMIGHVFFAASGENTHAATSTVWLAKSICSQ
ncbi:hypothetical protein BFW91_26810 [Pseudomonas fluorescens]|nr:hypothetical protein BFW91_26810 [Pseudomonas fluorescens]